MPSPDMDVPLPNLEETLRGADRDDVLEFGNRGHAASVILRPMLPPQPATEIPIVHPEVDDPGSGIMPVAPPPEIRSASIHPKNSNADGVPSGTKRSRLNFDSIAHARSAHLGSLPSVEKVEVKNVSQTIAALTVEFAYLVARCDGSIALKERTFIERYFNVRYHKQPALYNRVKSLCAYFESGVIDVDRCLTEIRQEMSEEHRKLLLRLAFDIAIAAGPINQKEMKFLKMLETRLNVTVSGLPAPDVSVPSTNQELVLPELTLARETSEKLPAPPRANKHDASQMSQTRDSRPAERAPTKNECLAVLRIDPAISLSSDLIRRHYQRLKMELDPRKVVSMGPEFVAMAEMKLAEAERAAEILITPFEEKLEPSPPVVASNDLRHNPDLDDLFGG